MKLGRSLGTELDEIVAQLLKKAGEVSTAGRDNFLAMHADVALGQMTISCSELRSINALVSKCAVPSTCACRSRCKHRSPCITLDQCAHRRAALIMPA